MPTAAITATTAIHGLGIPVKGLLTGLPIIDCPATNEGCILIVAFDIKLRTRHAFPRDPEL
jgi:hypothetical protein